MPIEIPAGFNEAEIREQARNIVEGIREEFGKLAAEFDFGKKYKPFAGLPEEAKKAGAAAAKQFSDSASQQTQALAKLQRAQGDYAGSIKTLTKEMERYEQGSAKALKVQTQIVNIQNQQARVNRGATFDGFLAGFAKVDSQLSGIGTKISALSNLPGLGFLSKLGQGATSASAGLNGLGASGSAAGAGLGVAGLAAGGLALGIGAVITAAALGTKALFDFALAGSNAADDLNDVALITGISAENLQIIKAAAIQSGASLGDFTRGAAAFGVKMGEISQDVNKSAAFLKAFGIDAKEAFKNPEVAVLEFGKRLTEIQSAALKTATAKEYLSRSGLKLLATFETLNEDGGKFGKTLLDQGQIVDATSLKIAGKLSDAVAGLGSKLESLSIRVATKSGPEFERAIASMGSAMDRLVPIAEHVTNRIAEKFAQTASEIDFFISLIGSLPGFVASLGRPGTSTRVAPPLSVPDDRRGHFRDTTSAAASRDQAVADALNAKATKAPRGGGAGSAKAALAELDPTVALQIAVLGEINKLAGKDLDELRKAYDEQKLEVDRAAAMMKLLSDTGQQKTKEFGAAIDKFVADTNKLFGVDQALQRGLITAPKPGALLPVAGFQQIDFGAAARLGGRPEFPGVPTPKDIDLIEEAATAYGRNSKEVKILDSVLEDMRSDQEQTFAQLKRNQLEFGRLFSVDPIRVQERALDGLLSRVKGASEIIADAQIGAMDSVFDFVDQGFARMTQGLGGVGRLISSILSDISRLFLSRQFAQFFGLGGGGAAGGGGSIGGGGGGGIGGILGGLFGGGGSSGGAFRTPGFAATAFNGAFGSGDPLGLGSSVSGQLGGFNGAFGGDPLGLGRLASGGAASGGGFGGALGGLLGGLAPTLGLALGGSLGAKLGGPSRLGSILGGAGGSFLGAGAGLAIFGALGGGLSGTSAAFASFALGPIGLAIGGALLLGGYLLGKSKQRGKDEQLADSYWVAEAQQIQELTRAVNNDQIDGQAAIAQAAALRQQTIAQLNQIKTSSVRESRLRNQLPDVDRVYVSQLSAAVERQSIRRRIGLSLVPEFDRGGRVPGFDRGRDEVLILARPGEVVLNRRQQEEVVARAGHDVFRQAGVPGFEAGGRVERVPSVTESGPIELNIDLFVGQSELTEAILRVMKGGEGKRVILTTNRNRQFSSARSF